MTLRCAKSILICSLAFIAGIPAVCQAPTGNSRSTNVDRDSRAELLLRQAVRNMGTLPADSTATGAVALIRGAKHESGQIRIVTLGSRYSLEEITTASGTQRFTFSDGDGSDNINNSRKVHSFELGASAQSTLFPLPLLAGLIDNPDVSITWIGKEDLSGHSAGHIRIVNTFASTNLTNLSRFSTRDIWIDTTSGLPLKIAYERREADGAVPTMRVEVSYSDFRNTSGVFYPFRIQKSLNGMHWADISIESVTFDNNLTADQFSIQ